MMVKYKTDHERTAAAVSAESTAQTTSSAAATVSSVLGGEATD